MKVAEIANQLATTRENIIQLQENEISLSMNTKKKGQLVRNGKETSHMKRKEIMCGLTKTVGAQKDELMQIMKNLRKKVIEFAHNTILLRHISIKKTEDRILTYFYGPEINRNEASFCRLCDVYQRTISKGNVANVRLGKMLLMDLFYRRVVVDLIELIKLTRNKGHRYVLAILYSKFLKNSFHKYYYF